MTAVLFAMDSVKKASKDYELAIKVYRDSITL